MDKTLKKKWVAALISGKYKQFTDGALRRNGQFCCLGVLRHVNNPRDNSYCAQYIPSAMLTHKHLEKFGFDFECAEELAAMNDAGVPFPVIAGFIQENM